MKRLFSCLLILAILLAMIVPGVQAAGLDVSGDLSSPKPTKTQIWEKWNQVTYATSLYKKAPSVEAPYAAGRLSDNFLKSGITYLNYVRYVANLPQVQLDDTLNENAQHGAVLLAAEDNFSHYPSQPSDMDDDFYSRGYGSTSSSNISARWGYEPLGSLQSAVSGCMADNNSLSNLQVVGHRRWLLNPTLLNVGFGYAQSNTGWSYITTQVLDRSGSGCAYDYISWPASGNFPTNLFAKETPWSVTLNPQKYQTPQRNNLHITITRQSDGKQWHFDSSTGLPSDNTQPYLTVDTGGYGISNCIIFHPGSRNVDAYEGVFQVQITGLYTKSGQAAQLTYEVDFFDVESYSGPVAITSQPKSATAANGKTVKTTVQATGDGLTYTWYFKNAGASSYKKSSITGATYSAKMSTAVNGRKVYCVIKDKYGNTVKTKTVTLKGTPVKITAQPRYGLAYEGKTAKVTVKATGDGLSYTWYYKNAGASAYKKSSVTGATYSVKMSASVNGRYLYCVVKDQYGNTVKTNTVRLKGRPVKITTQPANKTAANGKTVSTTVKATGDGLTYTWYFKNAGASSFKKSSVKGATYSVKMSSAVNGRKVYCVIKDKYGNTVTTKTVTLKATPVKITTQPVSKTVVNGKTVSTTVKATGDGLSYKWYYKNKGATKFSVSSVKTSTYSTKMSSAVNGRSVYCVVKDKFGNTVKTNTVTLRRK